MATTTRRAPDATPAPLVNSVPIHRSKPMIPVDAPGNVGGDVPIVPRLASAAAPVGSGKAAAAIACVAGRFRTDTEPETAWVVGKFDIEMAPETA